jgi:hypothetical protein
MSIPTGIYAFQFSCKPNNLVKQRKEHINKL